MEKRIKMKGEKGEEQFGEVESEDQCEKKKKGSQEKEEQNIKLGVIVSSLIILHLKEEKI